MVTAGLRVRFWIQAIFASATGVLLVMTTFWPDWIEVIFGGDPDRGDGSAEWAAVMVLAALTVALGGAARGEWRRARRARRARQARQARQRRHVTRTA